MVPVWRWLMTGAAGHNQADRCCDHRSRQRDEPEHPDSVWFLDGDEKGGDRCHSRDGPAASQNCKAEQPRRVPLPPEEGEETGDHRDEQERTGSQDPSGG